MENDNIQENLSRLLSDPEGMEKIRAMAESLLGGSAEPTKKDAPSQNDEAQMLMRAVTLLKNDAPDERGKLLLALKPHLGAERQLKVDRAVKLLRLAKLAPLLGESDIFKL